MWGVLHIMQVKMGRGLLTKYIKEEILIGIWSEQKALKKSRVNKC